MKLFITQRPSSFSICQVLQSTLNDEVAKSYSNRCVNDYLWSMVCCFMSEGMYLCMYVCMHACPYLRMYMRMYVGMCACVYVCACTRMYACVYVCNVCVCRYVRAY